MKAECKKWRKEKLAEIEALESYAPEKTIENVAKQYGLSPADIVKLNFNENLYVPRAKLVALLKEAAEECDVRLYPQEEEEKLRRAIVESLRLPQACVAGGTSSAGGMGRLIRRVL